MNTTKILRILPVFSGMLAIFAAAAAFPTAASAEEPAPKCRACAVTETGVPLLSKIPYVNRLFKNVTPREVEQIGVDFDFDIPTAGPAKCAIQAGCNECVKNASRPQVLVVRTTSQGKAVNACCANEACCEAEVAQAIACLKGGCEKEAGQGLSWERIVELSAHNAALETMLEAQEGIQEARAEMMEHLTEVLVENAKLEAKVESLAQQAEFTKEMLALASENARLKAQIEMGEAKLALVHEMAKLAIENEQLKLALKSRHPSGELSSDVEYLPPAPASKPGRLAPAKKASFQQPEPYPHPVGPEPIGPEPSR